MPITPPLPAWECHPQVRWSSVTPWPLGHAHSTCASLVNTQRLTKILRQAEASSPWAWPRHPVIFVADPHADAEAFVASLVASGCVVSPGANNLDFELTDRGHGAEFVIGGDCLDKGPSNLGLLRAVRHLLDKASRVTVLAGNHDVRLLIGLRALDLERDPTTEHLFLRMGPKVVPLLKEVHDTYLGDAGPSVEVPDEAECRRRMYPSPQWFDAFPQAVERLIPAEMVKRELVRMRRKVDVFEDVCVTSGLSLRQVYAAARHCRQLFFADDGEFAWFFHDMQLMRRHGSFLFVHAGIDDGIVALLEDHGIDEVNRRFHRLAADDLFRLYYGTLGNSMRTKYRACDLPLTAQGAARARQLGLHVVVHGHRNRTAGQRLVLRQGIMHVESDVTLDRNSRREEGLAGAGVGVTLIDPAGYVDGLSADYPDVKRLEPAVYLGQQNRQTHAA